MTNIEIFIALLLLFMAVPDVCQKLSRPALAFPIFVIVGMVLRPLVGTEVAGLLSAAGEVGFLLLPFGFWCNIRSSWPWRRFLA